MTYLLCFIVILQVTLASFMTYVITSDDNHLDAGKAFVSLSLFNILKYPINLLPMIVSFAIQVCMSNYHFFFILDEILILNMKIFNAT